MAYVKQVWSDDPSTVSPISAERLSHIEDGIYNIANFGVSPRQFGAVLDGITDDIIPIRYAVVHCLTYTLPLVNGQSLIPPLIMDGPGYVSAPVFVDRPENQTGWFRIIGVGPAGGFVTNEAINIFDSNYTGSVQNNPSASQLSNQVKFENVQFTSTNPGAYVINANKFVRTMFDCCYHNGIKLSKSFGNDYVQSLIVRNAYARGLSGKFFDAYDTYDVNIGGKFEVCSGTIFYVGHEAHGCNFGDKESLAQNCGDMFANIGIAKGVTITCGYAESLASHFAHIGTAYGASVKDCYIASTAANGANSLFYEVVVDEAISFEGSGNRFSHRGYEFTGTAKNAVVGAGDSAGVQLVNPSSGIITNLQNLNGFGVKSTSIDPGVTITIYFSDFADIKTWRIVDGAYDGVYIASTNWQQIIPYHNATGITVTKITGGATIKNNNASALQALIYYR